MQHESGIQIAFFQRTRLLMAGPGLVIGLFIGGTLFLLSIGLGQALRAGFPFAALAAGAYLFFRHPVVYIEFAWWLWYVTPLLARLVDLQEGWDPARWMISAPFLVTGVSAVTLIRRARLLRLPFFLPFLLTGAALFYGIGIGLIKNPMPQVLPALLEWAVPVLFGFHLAASGERYDDLSRATQRAFFAGILLMGGYGIFQYLEAPSWDRHWLIEAGVKSFGSPEPLGIRVWSTMNSPGTLSMYLMAGLILLLNARGFLRVAAMGLGSMALLLTLARSAWGALLIGATFLLLRSEGSRKSRSIAVLAALAAALFSLSLSEPFAGILSARFETFANLKEDGSLLERLDIYERGLEAVLAEPIGQGLGRIVSEELIDSAFLDMFLTLGWPGALLYLAGLFLFIIQIVVQGRRQSDPFVAAATAIVLAVTPLLLIASHMIEAAGVLFWAMMSFPLAAWHKSRR